MNARTNISLKINTIFAIVIATTWVCLPAFAQEKIKLAPLNPHFVSYMENTRRGIKSSGLRTADGHGLGLLPSPLDLSHLVGRANVSGAGLRAALPSSYDLRTLGRLTPVKDQAPYNTCWSFASYGSFESCFLLSSGETNDFSENNMVNRDGFDYGFDHGGNAIMATAYLARWAGPVKESDDPYPNPDGSPAGLPPIQHVQSVEIIGRRSDPLANDEIKQAVVNHGALYASMRWDDSAYNPSTYAFYMADPAGDGHAVAIVGWDDQYSRTNFVASSQPSGDGAFIAKNSWGTNWGDSGYFYVSYYDGFFADCASYLFLNAESTNLYNQVYQYDPFGWVASLGFGSDGSPDYSSNTAWGANIFTVTNGGDLSAVGIHATSTNANYEIFVYTYVTSSQPRSGVLRINQAGSLTNAGYYTITLSSPVSLSAGQSFSIVVKFTTPSFDAPLPIEYALAGYSSQATASLGQSFLSTVGSFWEDTVLHDPDNPTWNVCIKAFMSATAYSPYSPPTGLSATDGTYTDKVRLTWSAVTNATGYEVWRHTGNSSGAASKISSPDPTETNYDDTSATAGITYYYWMKALNAAGASFFSASDSGFIGVVGPLITANGLVGDVPLNSGDAITVAVQMMNIEPYLGVEVDWWVIARAGSSWYYLNSSVQWTPFDGNLSHCHPVNQGGLFNLSSTEVLNITGLGIGSYAFWFAVDYPMDGILNLSGPILYDKVTVVVQ